MQLAEAEPDKEEVAKKEFQALFFFACVIFTLSGILYLVLRRLKSRNSEIELNYEKDIFIKILDIILWSLTWYGFSVSLVIYNKWLLNSWNGGFNFPLIMTTAHMVIKLILTRLV